jgi:hypothetical protein
MMELDFGGSTKGQGSPPPIEAVLSWTKPPWKPRVSGRMGFWFGPLAGGIVAFVNLRRLGARRKANLTLLSTLATLILVLVILIYVIPYNLLRILDKFIVLGIEVAGFKIFPSIQSKDFETWQVNHPGANTANGWKAMGWGILGLLSYFALIVLVVMLGMLGD